uniref:Uncharacterized protein n=1 Tax=Cannabis sativa TaxID=3483 RepID=A0A803PQZ8_CANSA
MEDLLFEEELHRYVAVKRPPRFTISHLEPGELKSPRKVKLLLLILLLLVQPAKDGWKRCPFILKAVHFIGIKSRWSLNGSRSKRLDP